MEDQYSTLIATLAAAGTGGLIALVGVFVKDRGDTSRLTVQLANEARKHKEELLRSRGEELYELIDKWLNALFSYHMTSFLVIDGTISYENALDLQNKHGEKGGGNFARIEMLIDVYFPEVRKTYEQVIAGRDKINTILLAHRHAYDEGEVDRNRFVDPFKRGRSEVLDGGKQLKADVLDRIRVI